jgi:superfamily I DNA/RNA helicase/DNA polymerase III epsilon subunit-like protein
VTFEPTVQQRKAIEAPLGPVLVLAGPGAGKTWCLIERVRHLITRLGIRPDRICAVTFTNKAAEEIAHRLNACLGSDGGALTRGTIHSLCLSLLREFPSEAGLAPGFGIADEDYQRGVLRRLRVPDKRQGQVLGVFSRHRLQGYVPTGGDLDLYREYADILRSRNVVDFDDLVCLTECLLRTKDPVARSVRSRWDYVLVDEFQDLNFAQYGILRSLVADHRNLFGVGDDEQSIFSWTGADPRIVERFRDDFGIIEPIVLDQNRRCSTQIFDAARRLIALNTKLFTKDIQAFRDSPYDVEVRVFPDEEAEADWLVRDLLADRQRGTHWGDYGILYRSHKIGEVLEGRFLRLNVPCRLARGQALLDNKVVAYVINSLRVVRAPDDPNLVDVLAHQLLPKALLQDVITAAPAGTDIVNALRRYGKARHKGDPGAKKAWRFVYHVENLRAMPRSHGSIESIVTELLSQRVGPARNPLEERYHDLSDPLAYPGARALAERLRQALETGCQVWLEPHRGAEIALLGMLRAGGVAGAARRRPGDLPGPGDLVLRAEDAAGESWTLLVFKALQLLHAPPQRDPLQDFVAFDLETTELDRDDCEVVDIAAVRVRAGKVVDQFQSLVRCNRPISAGASAAHGYADADLVGQPTFDDVWPLFRQFVGNDLMVAHNGVQYDVPILRRLSAPFGGVDDLVFYDTLPLCRSLSDQSAKLSDLALKYNLDTGHSHHALDDSLVLARLLPHLRALEATRNRKAAQVHLLDFLGLGLALEPTPRVHASEVHLLVELSRPYALGRYSDCLELYAGELASGVPDAPSLDEVIERLGGQALMERLRRERSPADRYPAAMARLQSLMDASRGETLAERLDDLLGMALLSSSVEVDKDPHRVNLLTLHSTKGLEFSRVYIVGVEDQQIPGWKTLQDNVLQEMEEARRLLYVGMTRAMDRLVLTRTEHRNGKPSGGDLFILEAGLRP